MVLVVMALDHVTQANRRCKPTSTKPDINAMEVRNIAFFDERNYAKQVANMVGYVEFFGDNSTYMPVEADWVYNAQPDDDGNILVIVKSMCFFFGIKYKIVPGNQVSNFYYQFNNLEMIIKNRAGDRKKICEFDQQFAFNQLGYTRYSCQELLTHQCSHEGKPVARLVLKSFELELDGDLENVELEQFSKIRWGNSCEHWNE